ncbi:MAG TPA: NAD(P)-dependent oxidoreductase [Nocardioidaceae bacterium]|nr:NAD(P)-dependent oxidoreductase [Nocardioidaceae bacterium]
MTATPGPAEGPAVFVAPGAAPVVVDAVQGGGGRLVSDHRAAEALVWSDKDVEGLSRRLHAGVRWVQLPDAGVERWLSAGVVTREPVFTSARGCYGPQVAEHALALLLAGARRLPECAALTSWPTEHRPTGRSLRDAVVTVVGVGDIGSSLIAMLAPSAQVHAVTRSGHHVEGAVASYPVTRLEEALRQAHFVVLAAPSTPETRRMIARQELGSMRPDAWLVNVARGDLVDTDALVDALAAKRIAGAALDVTDPEPLPDGHPLWSMSQVLITPHVANPPEAKAASLAVRVRENTRRFRDGRPLVGVVDPANGY